MSATATAVRDRLAAGAPREHVAAELVVAGLIHLLAADPEIAAMAQANDAEHFIEGCKTPAFEAKVAAALLTVKAAA